MASVVTADGAVRIFHSVIAAMAVTAAMVVIAAKPGTLSVADRPAHAGLFFYAWQNPWHPRRNIHFAFTPSPLAFARCQSSCVAARHWHDGVRFMEKADEHEHGSGTGRGGRATASNSTA